MAARADLHVVSTADDLLDAFTRMAARRGGPMTFAAPWWLLGFLALPAVLAAYARRSAVVSGVLGALAAQGLVVTGTESERRWRPHLPFALVMLALALLVIATSRPMATITTIRRVGDRRGCDRRLELDGREGRRALPHRGRKGGGGRLRQGSASGVRIGVVAFGAAPVIVQRPTFDHTADLRAIGALSLGGGTSCRRASSAPSTRSPARR